MTATIFELRGLRADNLQAFLALLGVLRVVDLQCPQWQRARARWRKEAAGGLAEIEIGLAEIEIEAANAVSESNFVAATAEGARELLASLAESIPETDAVETAETVVNMNRKNLQAAFEGVFVAPPPPSMETKKSPLSSPLLLSEKKNCHTKADILTKLQTRDYEAALLDDWFYARSKRGDQSGLNWDPSDRREHARWHKEPTNDKNYAIEKGGLALAICGWPSFMPAPIQGKGRKITNAAPGWWEGMRKLREGAAKTEWQADLSWPLWEKFADLPEIEATLADNFWRADKIDRADMKERGVWRVMRAVRMRGREKAEAGRKFFGWAKPI